MKGSEWWAAESGRYATAIYTLPAPHELQLFPASPRSSPGKADEQT